MPRKICDQCGKPFIQPDAGSWVYKLRSYHKGTRGKTVNFCSFSCQEKYKKEHGFREYNVGFKN